MPLLTIMVLFRVMFSYFPYRWILFWEYRICVIFPVSQPNPGHHPLGPGHTSDRPLFGREGHPPRIIRGKRFHECMFHGCSCILMKDSHFPTPSPSQESKRSMITSLAFQVHEQKGRDGFVVKNIRDLRSSVHEWLGVPFYEELISCTSTVRRRHGLCLRGRGPRRSFDPCGRCGVHRCGRSMV